MSWYYLLAAAAIDAVYGVAIHYSKGFSVVWPTLTALTAAACTSYLLALSMKGIPAGVAFVVWSGLGSLGVVIYGICALGEPLNFARAAMMLLILIGVGGLKLHSPT